MTSLFYQTYVCHLIHIQWILLLMWTLKNEDTCIIHTLIPSYSSLKIILDNQDTFDWSQGVHIDTGSTVRTYSELMIMDIF